MYLVKTPQFIQKHFPTFTWKVPGKEPVLYLTFDDGPVPEVTPWVLEQLEKYNAKATFFCVGDNVRRHPDVFHQVLDGGHSIGNHTYSHLNAWNTDNLDYFHDVRVVLRSHIPDCSGRLTADSSRSRPRFYSAIITSLCGMYSAVISILPSRPNSASTTY